MEYKIVFNKRYLNDLLKVLEYLEQEWRITAANEFLSKLNNLAGILRFHPHIGAPSTKVPNARALTITKHNRLYYRIEKDKIVFIFQADTRRKNYKH